MFLGSWKHVSRSWYVLIRKLWEIKVWFLYLKESSKGWWYMCASCRILHDSVLLDTFNWWIHDPSVLCGCSCRRVYVHSPLMIGLVWGPIQVLLQDVSINEVVYILHKEFHLVHGIDVLGFQSHHYLSGYEIRWQEQTIVAYSSNWLSVSRAILAGITFLPIPRPMTACTLHFLGSPFCLRPMTASTLHFLGSPFCLIMQRPVTMCARYSLLLPWE